MLLLPDGKMVFSWATIAAACSFDSRGYSIKAMAAGIFSFPQQGIGGFMFI